MSILPSQPATIGKVLDISIQLYKASFKKVLGLILIMGFIQLPLIYVNQDILAAQNNSALIMGNLYRFSGYLLFSMLIGFVGYTAIISRIHHVVIQESDTLLESCMVFFKKFFKLFFAGILFYIFFTLGLFLLVIPGIYVMLSMSFFMYFIILESAGPYGSLKASHKLIKGNWWRTAGVYTAPTVIYIIFMLAISLPAVYFPSLRFLQAVLAPFFVSYFLCLAYVQFHDLKLRKFGDDIAERLVD